MRLAACATLTMPLVLANVMHAASGSHATSISPLSHPGAVNLNRLPLSFEPNVGQAGKGINFVTQGQRYEAYLGSTSLTMALFRTHSHAGPSPSRDVRSRATATVDLVTMAFLGSNAHVHPQGISRQASITNYLLGNNRQAWRTLVPNFAVVSYQGLYPGIDLLYHGNRQQLEYDYVVHPGADPSRIHVAFAGLPQPTLDAHGNLLLSLPGGALLQHAPRAYQQTAHGRVAVPSRFVLLHHGQVGVALGAYDRSKDLLIDPTINSSQYLGGSDDDSANALTVDATGNQYVTGFTFSLDFPLAGASYQAVNNGKFVVMGFNIGSSDAFVSKFSPTGALLYSTYLGGAGTGLNAQEPFPIGSAFAGASREAGDVGFGIAVDSTGNAYITGATFSAGSAPGGKGFPVTVGAPQTVNNGLANSASNAFVTELNPTGSSILFSTFLGGAGIASPGARNSGAAGYGDAGYAISVDSGGNIYITGQAFSTGGALGSGNFPTVNAAQSTNNGAANGLSNAFVAKISGGSLSFSTFLGGSGSDAGTGIGVGPGASPSVYVTGFTQSPATAPFPTAGSPLQASQAGAQNAFVSVLSSSGALTNSTYFGGAATDIANGIAVDSLGNAYIVGSTTSSCSFPYKGAYLQTCTVNSLAFVAKLNPSLSAELYGTVIGGSGGDYGNAIAVDGFGAAYVTGATSSIDFPVLKATQTALKGVTNAFVTKFNPAGSGLVFSTFLGGSNTDSGYGIAVDPFGNYTVAGVTNSPDFPTTTGQLFNLGVALVGGAEDPFDGFVTRYGVRCFVIATITDTGAREGVAYNIGAQSLPITLNYITLRIGPSNLVARNPTIAATCKVGGFVAGSFVTAGVTVTGTVDSARGIFKNGDFVSTTLAYPLGSAPLYTVTVTRNGGATIVLPTTTLAGLFGTAVNVSIF